MGAGSISLEEYVGAMSPLMRTKLYGSRWSCQAVVRALEPLARLYALRAAFCEAALPAATLRTWCKPEYRPQHAAAVRALVRLDIFQTPNAERTAAEEEGGEGVRMNPVFQRHLQEALVADLSAAERVAEDALGAAELPAPRQLQEHAQACWESLLLFLVGVTDAVPGGSGLPEGFGAPLDAEALFVGMGLMARREGADPAAPARITELGFRFLLKDTNEQMWAILKHFLAGKQSQTEAAATLSFLLQLGFRNLSEAYRVEALGPAERATLNPLAQLGLVYTFEARQRGSTWVLPTQLACTLCGGASNLAAGAGGAAAGYIVVETNYRVYAYTASVLQRAILSLFTFEEYVLPNMYVGRLTRDQVIKCGVELGMTAEEIIAYLRDHAHPQVAHNVPVVPDTISDSLRLWEAESNRVSWTNAVLYSSFASAGEYAAVEAYARGRNALVWCDRRAQKLAVPAGVHDEMRKFIRQNRQQQGAGGGAG